MCMNHWVIFKKCIDSVGLRSNQIFCGSNKIPGDDSDAIQMDHTLNRRGLVDDTDTNHITKQNVKLQL